MRFARDAADLDRVLRLRFAVFNLELREGLEESHRSGRDEDEFDRHCHHLLVEHTASGEVIGTYRLQTAEMARGGIGYYTGAEFELAALPEDLLGDAIELGRACIHRQHRKTPVLFLLWKGLARYVAHNRKRWLFGCCSLTSQDSEDGWRAAARLETRGDMRRDLWAPTRPEYDCAPPASPADRVQPLDLPALFEIYLRYGGKVVSPPAIDRRFKTIDFLLLFDVAGLDERTRRKFFG
jgi:putative hemolysin